jgi:hypothetical protein
MHDNLEILSATEEIEFLLTQVPISMKYIILESSFSRAMFWMFNGIGTYEEQANAVRYVLFGMKISTYMTEINIIDQYQ